MQRLLSIALLLAFLFCYLEWGERGAFVFRIEYDLFFSGETETSAFIHPAILIPLSGQIILLINAFQPRPRRMLLLAGLIMSGCLVLLFLLAGSLAGNAPMILSTLPFLGLALYTIWHVRRKKKVSSA